MEGRRSAESVSRPFSAPHHLRPAKDIRAPLQVVHPPVGRGGSCFPGSGQSGSAAFLTVRHAM
ncbi:hypothetical protein ACFYNW_07260 [Streptomyces virginiae]|uniref:hypothetical protein n=1 Tax=Streptomyces virginiae TaxID=1961 RepID=UPI0036E862AC